MILNQRMEDEKQNTGLADRLLRGPQEVGVGLKRWKVQAGQVTSAAALHGDHMSSLGNYQRLRFFF